MGHQLHARTLVLLAVLTPASTLDARASDTANGGPDHARPTFSHVRTAEPRFRTLIDDAIATSPTVRALVERITASDVVVFVTCEPNPNARTAGRLNFMTASGGVRYVVIRLQPRHRVTAIAMLAHELQHAAEIAATPSIVDTESMAREYARIGYRNHSAHGIAFDTKEAVDVARRVVDELTTKGVAAD